MTEDNEKTPDFVLIERSGLVVEKITIDLLALRRVRVVVFKDGKWLTCYDEEVPVYQDDPNFLVAFNPLYSSTT